MIDCLIAGRNGQGAEYVLTVFTTDGDPITLYYRVQPGTEDAEVFVDSSEDRYGGGWQHRTCRVVELSADALNLCRSSG
ncbi:hypothetical protein [Rhodococcus marinonascens]|uniref:hypothetical protein n=1 Tax=Rhodococcus marinonascens TaxID=38311 RepID=UPI001114C79A|nr:hypothetical protein [Rhodococcus marinonascens]